jgi:hypothetical protein
VTDHSAGLNITSVYKLINMRDEKPRSHPARSGMTPRSRPSLKRLPKAHIARRHSQMYISGQPGNESGKSCAHSTQRRRWLVYSGDCVAVAKLIPSKPIDFNNSEGEIRVFEALSTLPDSWYVFHSLRWLSAPERAESGAIPRVG